MPEQPNIIFLMLDTVRADVFSAYGGNLKLKTIDSLAKKSVVYKNAIAPGTYTLPSHLAIFFGRRPRAIKELNKDNIENYNQSTDPYLKKYRYVDENSITLAEHLAYLGYDTALFSNNPFLSPSAGVSKGFAHVENTFVDKKLKGGSPQLRLLLGMINHDIVRNNVLRLSAFMAHIFPDYMFDGVYLRLRKKVDRHYADECEYYSLDSGAVATNQKVKRHIKIAGGGPHFLFLNYMEGHEGYPTNLLTERYIVQDKWLHIVGHSPLEDVMVEKQAYLKRIEYLDGKIGELLKSLRSEGKLRNAYIIITADHGQAFMEHGQMYHNVFPYNEVVKVPLIIAKFESGKQININKIISKPVSLSSLNEIIRSMGLGNVPKFDVSSGEAVFSDHIGITEVWDTYLLNLIKHRSKHADKIYRMKQHYNQFATAIFYKNYKLIHFYGKKKDELYKISDLKEENNIIGKNRSLARKILRCNDRMT